MTRAQGSGRGLRRQRRVERSSAAWLDDVRPLAGLHHPEPAGLAFERPRAGHRAKLSAQPGALADEGPDLGVLARGRLRLLDPVGDRRDVEEDDRGEDGKQRDPADAFPLDARTASTARGGRRADPSLRPVARGPRGACGGGSSHPEDFRLGGGWSCRAMKGEIRYVVGGSVTSRSPRPPATSAPWCLVLAWRAQSTTVHGGPSRGRERTVTRWLSGYRSTETCRRRPSSPSPRRPSPARRMSG